MISSSPCISVPGIAYLILMPVSCQVCAQAQNDPVPWQITMTEMYRPFTSREVVIGPKGQVYCFETGKNAIHHYGADGKFAGNIGRMGSGPGEFRGVIRMWYQAATSRLLVLDASLSRVQVFKADGQFVEAIKFPVGQTVFPTLTKYGWAYPHFSPQSPNDVLFISDQRFEKATLVGSWLRPPIGLTGSVGHSVARFDVAADTWKFTASADGSLLFLYVPGKPEIKMLDARTAEVKGAIQLGLKPLPIDDSWVENKMAEVEKMNTPVKIEYSAGDYFPLVKDLRAGPWGNLLVYTSIHFVKEDIPPLVFNQAGQEVQSPFSGAALKRIVGIYENMAYVTTFDPAKEEAGLAKIDSADVNRFVASRP